MGSKKLSFGICGFGFMGRTYFAHLSNHPRARVAAVCSKNNIKRADQEGEVGNLRTAGDKALSLEGVNVYEDVDDLIYKLGRNVRIYGACDPSLGKRHSHGDNSAIITAVIDRRYDRVYVIDADIARRTPNETIDRIVMLSKMYEYYTFVVETNQFQVLLVDQLEQALERHRISIDIEQVDHRSNKQTRIEVLEPLVTRGVVRFSRRHGTLMEQLRQFPLGAHDDGPDALEMVIREALDPTNYSSVFQIA